jgi:phosphatidylglycerophosphate synthase
MPLPLPILFCSNQRVSGYEPTARRPIANVFRLTAHWATALCVRTGIHPDAISYSSMVVAGIAAVCFWRASSFPALLIVAPLFCFVRLWLNMLDGMVAIAGGKASVRGEILNDLPDRVSDVLIFVGVAESGWMNPRIGYLTAIASVLAAYVGLFGQALGASRQFGGVMSKPWRMVVLGIGSWAAFLFNSPAWRLSSLQILDLTCLVIIAGCVQTIAVRLKRIMRDVIAK